MCAAETCVLKSTPYFCKHVEVISTQMCSSLKQRQQHIRTQSGYTDKLAHFPWGARVPNAYTHKCAFTRAKHIHVSTSTTCLSHIQKMLICVAYSIVLLYFMFEY